MKNPWITFDIILNGGHRVLHSNKASYDDIVALAYPYARDVLYSITYSKGPAANQQGILSPGQVVQVQNGMNFNAYFTGNA